MSNHEGYPDPTAETAVERVFRLDKKKKLYFVRRYPVHTGDLSGEPAAASGKRDNFSAPNGKFDAGKRQEVNPDECDL